MRFRAFGSILVTAGALSAGCGDNREPAAVTVMAATGPLAGVDVVVHDALGEPTAHAVTDDNGRALAVVEEDEGAMLTVMVSDPSSGDHTLLTFVDVKPGDDLTFTPPQRRPSVEMGTAYLVVDALPTTSIYVFETPCSTIYTASVARAIELEMYSHCLSSDGGLHVVVTAYDAQGMPLAQASVRDVPWTDSMVVTMPRWNVMGRYYVGAWNAPAGTRGVFASLVYGIGDMTLSSASAWAGSPSSAGEGADLMLAYAPGFADRIQATIGVAYNGSMSMLLEQRASLPGMRGIDLGAELLPEVSRPYFDASAPERPVVTWFAPSDMTRADGVIMLYSWDEPSGDSATWMFVAPTDVALPMLFPALPAELASWAPSARPYASDLWYVDAEWLPSYDDLKAWVTGGERSPSALLPAHDDATLAFTTSRLLVR